MQTLIERLKDARGKSRVLDFEIHLAVFGDPLWPTRDMKGRVTNPNARMSDYLAGFRDVIDADDQDFDFPRYTASLDAARSLIPKVYYWRAGEGRMRAKEPLGGVEIVHPKTRKPVAEGEHENIILAFCIAALRVHGQSTNGETK